MPLPLHSTTQHYTALHSITQHYTALHSTTPTRSTPLPLYFPLQENLETTESTPYYISLRYRFLDPSRTLRSTIQPRNRLPQVDVHIKPYEAQDLGFRHRHLHHPRAASVSDLSTTGREAISGASYSLLQPSRIHIPEPLPLFDLTGTPYSHFCTESLRRNRHWPSSQATSTVIPTSRGNHKQIPLKPSNLPGTPTLVVGTRN